MNQSRGVFFLFLLLSASFFACSDGFDDYSKSPRDLLSFSVDTLHFDTVLTTVNTPVSGFMVYNRNNKALLISSIRLKNAGQSGFKMNVDGMAGASFQNVEIRANDSLYVFVDIKPDKQGNNYPVIITDYIDFITNGQQQQVVLEAYGQDVVVWRGLTISSDSVLDNQKPFLIYDSLVIDEGIVVDMKEGTTFYMHKNAEILVKGTLRIHGSPDKPVVIRGDRMDAMIGIPYDLIPGQWGGIRFAGTSFDNVIEYACIRNGNFGLKCELSEPERMKLNLRNVILTNFKGRLIQSVNCRIDAENCEFSNSQGVLLHLTGGSYSFTHCTIANYYASYMEAGWGNSDNETVRLGVSYVADEADGDTAYYPVLQADFYNTIVCGMKDRSASKISLEKSDKAVVNYYFENCLINADAENDDANDPDIVPSVVNCLINQDPKFVNTDPVKDGKSEFIYDFRIDSISPARNVANTQIAKRLPYDLRGVDRFLDEWPDIGAYEYLKE